MTDTCPVMSRTRSSGDTSVHKRIPVWFPSHFHLGFSSGRRLLTAHSGGLGLRLEHWCPVLGGPEGCPEEPGSFDPWVSSAGPALTQACSRLARLSLPTPLFTFLYTGVKRLCPGNGAQECLLPGPPFLVALPLGEKAAGPFLTQDSSVLSLTVVTPF